MNREQFADFLNPIIHEVYDLTLREKKDFVSELYDVNTTKLWEETIHGVGALGLMQPWAGTVHYDDANPLYKKTFVQKKYSLGLQVERELWEFSQHAKIKDRIKGLATSVFRTRQLHAVSVFNNAFTTNGADGVPLCSVSHPFSPSDPTVQSNRDTLPLDAANLEAVAIKMQDLVRQLSQIKPCRSFDRLKQRDKTITAKSCPDAIARQLAEYVKHDDTVDAAAYMVAKGEKPIAATAEAMTCLDCGSPTLVEAEGCQTCYVCGFSKCG